MIMFCKTKKEVNTSDAEDLEPWKEADEAIVIASSGLRSI